MKGKSTGVMRLRARQPGLRSWTAKRASPCRLLLSHELLGGERRVWIEHDAQRYLLQITKSNKLILTK